MQFLFRTVFTMLIDTEKVFTSQEMCSQGKWLNTYTLSTLGSLRRAHLVHVDVHSSRRAGTLLELFKIGLCSLLVKHKSLSSKAS